MTRVLVAVKRVVDSSGQATLTEDRQALDGRFAGYTIGAHDSCAIELAIQAAEATGGTVTVVSVGVPEAVEQIRTALGLGAHAGVLVETDPTALGPADVAAELAAVVHEADSAGEPYELVLLGNDAADTGDFQVPIRLAHAVGLPIVTGAATAEIAGETVVATVTGPYGDETYEVPLPVVVSVLEGGIEPRYPSLKGRMAAKKIEIVKRAPVGTPAGGGRVAWHLPDAPAASSESLGKGPEAAPAVVDLFEKMGVLR